MSIQHFRVALIPFFAAFCLPVFAITEAPSLVEPENVTRDTATFNLPFISLGQVGEGKLMVIGNPHYKHG